MTLAVEFRRAARTEFIATAAWYEEQRPSLGVEFITEVERCISLVSRQPLLYAMAHNGVRRITTERFPYSIYFRAEPKRIVVLAVFHGRRDPTVLQRRL